MEFEADDPAQAVRIEITSEVTVWADGTLFVEYDVGAGYVTLATISGTRAKTTDVYSLTASEIATVDPLAVAMRLRYVAGGGGGLPRTFRCYEFRLRVEQ